MMRLRWIGVLTAMLMSGSAHADTWPSKLIKAVIPYGAGSAADVVPRVVFDRLSAEFGQPIVIENRAGAGGTIGSGVVARAEADGYTVLAQSSAHSIAPAIYPDLQYDPHKDFVSALMIGYSANVMIVPPSRPWKTIQDFLAAAKAKESTISFGSVGVGTATHISGEKFRLAAGFKATHIPYRGGSEVITDILGGRIDFYFCPLATALPLIREGQVRALLVSTAKRAAELPDIPTPVDIGFPDAESSIWFGVFLPSKTPRDIVEKFHTAGVKVLASPEMQKSLQKLAITPWPMTPAEIDDLVAREIKANVALIKAAGIN
ncbi:tripartite tricarboxylate transporter substrate binding protein [Bradyrhizobium prioriisuperbiae]|uniref:Bug family tripartite tricarboxylate transporter substrate binding protein n=1 Tax=Bradyrhizobium prioriisuperbiae TaxID=2854389 RepID=UPI0028E98EE4|nr:tripartite tricarboxylate transporter substrate binding protein [Bradyrhizobium prioritasuperba]